MKTKLTIIFMLSLAISLYSISSYADEGCIELWESGQNYFEKAELNLEKKIEEAEMLCNDKERYSDPRYNYLIVVAAIEDINEHRDSIVRSRTKMIKASKKWFSLSSKKDCSKNFKESAKNKYYEARSKIQLFTNATLRIRKCVLILLALKQLKIRTRQLRTRRERKAIRLSKLINSNYDRLDLLELKHNAFCTLSDNHKIFQMANKKDCKSVIRVANLRNKKVSKIKKELTKNIHAKLLQLTKSCDEIQKKHGVIPPTGELNNDYVFGIECIENVNIWINRLKDAGASVDSCQTKLKSIIEQAKIRLGKYNKN